MENGFFDLQNKFMRRLNIIKTKFKYEFKNTNQIYIKNYKLFEY